MSDPFEFINPLESFQAAREDPAPAEITAAGHGVRRRIGLWVAGASIVSIGALIFAYAFAPNGGEWAGKQAPIESRAASVTCNHRRGCHLDRFGRRSCAILDDAPNG